jgi:hypothetical protein
MDNEMINRCVEAATVLNDGYQMLLLKTPINEIVIKVIETMREPTEKMGEAADLHASMGVALLVWQSMIDSILND